MNWFIDKSGKMWVDQPYSEAVCINTICPKIGAAQWTCTKKECVCHLKENIKNG